MASMVWHLHPQKLIEILFLRRLRAGLRAGYRAGVIDSMIECLID
jgi:hypothetical protein